MGTNPKDSIAVHFRFIAYPIFSKSSYDFDLAVNRSILHSSLQPCGVRGLRGFSSKWDAAALELSQFRTIHLCLQPPPMNTHKSSGYSRHSRQSELAFLEAVCLRLQNAKEENWA
jgi:hypothetical protein